MSEHSSYRQGEEADERGDEPTQRREAARQASEEAAEKMKKSWVEREREKGVWPPIPASMQRHYLDPQVGEDEKGWGKLADLTPEGWVITQAATVAEGVGVQTVFSAKLRVVEDTVIPKGTYILVIAPEEE